MDEADVVKALLAKRDDLLERITTLQREIDGVRFDITGIESTIHLFVPGLPFHQDTTKRRLPSLRLFRPSELSRLLVRILRESGADVAMADLTTAVMRTKALPMDDRDTRAAIARSVSASLSKLKKRGAVVRTEMAGGVSVWRLAARP